MFLLLNFFLINLFLIYNNAYQIYHYFVRYQFNVLIAAFTYFEKRILCLRVKTNILYHCQLPIAISG